MKGGKFIGKLCAKSRARTSACGVGGVNGDNENERGLASLADWERVGKMFGELAI